jgi:hydroxyacylglutathione hydrolase
MKKPVKIILIIIGVLVLFFVAFSVFMMIKFGSEVKKMSPLSSKMMSEGIYSVKDEFVNFYFIENNKKYISIDAGNSLKNSEKEIKKLGINPDDVVALFLTHTDSDHIGALKLFKNAKIYIMKEEEEILSGGKTKRMMMSNNKLDVKYETLSDNQELNIDGITIKAILTPGHTTGSACYLINNIYLFTGDNLSLKNGKAGLFNDFFNMSSKIQAKSQHKIKELKGVKYIFTAHYGYSDDFNKAFGK